MPKRSVTITLDEELIERVELDRGLAPLSALMNRFLEIIYAPEHGIANDLQACRKWMGFRNTPETIGFLLRDSLESKLEELKTNPPNHLEADG